MKAITCVSWNILAQRYASSPRDDWETRLIKIFFRLQDENDTIVCLQEVELEGFRSDFLYLCRKCGYNYVIHEVNKKRPNPIGNVILWKAIMFTATDPWSNSTSVGVSLWHDGKELQVASVHLKAGDHEETRISQLRSTLKYLKGPRVLLTGDFNDNLKGGLTESLVSFDIHETPAGCWARGQWCNFDQVVTKGFDVEVDLKLCGETPIPSAVDPSDHLPLSFTLLEPKVLI